jgi:acyl carrier protein
MRTIEQRVIELIADQMRVKESEINRATNLADDLRCDDLDRVEFQMELEDEFGLPISDADFAQLLTVGAVIDYIVGRLEQGDR